MKAAPFGRYTLTDRLAAGGTAEVFLAQQAGPGAFRRTVVIKRALPAFTAHEEGRALFAAEAQLLADLGDPALPYLVEFGVEAGHHYMAIERIRGLDVGALWRAGVEAGRVMPFPVSVSIVASLAATLARLHAATDEVGNPLGVVHRDVNPANVLVERGGAVRLIDLGVALSTRTPAEMATTPRGTVGYMAPEQIRGEPVDARADVYALGVLLYELTTGARLHGGPEAARLTRAVDEDPRPPTEVARAYPPGLEGLVLDALARDAAARTPSAERLSALLEQLAHRMGWPLGQRVVGDYAASVMAPEDDAPTLPGDEGPQAGDPEDLGSQVDWPTPAVLDFAVLPAAMRDLATRRRK